jgi:thiol-disulfide isomerase/thioredoxin
MIVKDGVSAMNQDRPLGVKPAWWLAGGCALVISCLIFAGMGATLGWLVLGREALSDAVSIESVDDVPARLRGNPIGQIAPPFSLQDVAGNEVSLDALRGHPLLINFWATWCGPCREEMPTIEAVYQQYEDDGLVVLAIDVQENPEVASVFAGWLGVSFTILDDGTGDVARRYRVTAFPTSFFVDREGIIRAWQAGAMDRPLLERHLAKILK